MLSLLIAVGVSCSLILLRGDQSIELFLALVVVCATGIAAGAVLFGNAPSGSPSPEKGRRKDIPPASSATRAKSPRSSKNIPRPARVSPRDQPEPEIYFYARRRSATGHIYTYALMEAHPYAARLQEEMIKQVEEAKPEYVVFIQNQSSWLRTTRERKEDPDWWPKCHQQNLQLIQTVATRQGAQEFADREPALPVVLVTTCCY